MNLLAKQLKRVLCLGAHSDDIEIGCGGTLLKWASINPDLKVFWVVFSGNEKRRQETRKSAREFLRGVKDPVIQTESFRDSFFPMHWAEVKETFEAIKRKCDPDLVFTHYRDDRHQDHRVLSDLAWNTFRRHLILEYEIIKYDGDLGQPNVYVELEEKFCKKKVATILKHFQTQGNKHWFTEDTFLSMMRLRGIECAARTRFAEAFYGRKIRL